MSSEYFNTKCVKWVRRDSEASFIKAPPPIGAATVSVRRKKPPRGALTAWRTPLSSSANEPLAERIRELVMAMLGPPRLDDFVAAVFLPYRKVNW
jgi:hypothetical protein